MNASHFNSIVTLFITIFLWLPRILTAQEVSSAMPVNPETKLITYQEVVTVVGKKKEMFNRAIEWINMNYKNPADVTKVRDPESGLIQIIHRFYLDRIDDKGNKVAAGIVVYTLRLELKDERFRYTITDMSLKQSSRYPIERWLDKTDKAYNPNYELYLAQLDKQAKELIESLKKSMQQVIQKKQDIW